MASRLRIAVLAISLLVLACRSSDGPVAVEPAFPHLSFDQPVDIQHASDGSDRLFVVEKSGLIRVFANDPEIAAAEVFLDLRDRIDDPHLEMGLLGLAFHPDYEANGQFFVNYTAAEPRRTVVSRFEVDPSDPNRSLPDSETIILEIAQPYQTHNGGRLLFGPDGTFYIGMGDGGWAGDPDENAEDPTNLLGAVLRIDVDRPSGDRNYGIPPDNPFVGGACEECREEIWAYGFRNPWRFSIDSPTGTMWLADVGQESWEEIDIIEKGGNYGWDLMEGTHCYEPPSDCDETGLTPPVWEFAHRPGNSVTGGLVYRGAEVPEIFGHYVFGGWGTGEIWTIPADDPMVGATEILDTNLRISTFGTDEAGELYVANFGARGGIYRLVSTGGSPVEDEAGPRRAARLDPVRPNPFQDVVILSYTLAHAAHVELAIYDVRGRLIRMLSDAYRAAGSYETSWDGTIETGEPTAPGVYIGRLFVDRTPVASRPMVRLGD